MSERKEQKRLWLFLRLKSEVVIKSIGSISKLLLSLIILLCLNAACNRVIADNRKAKSNETELPCENSFETYLAQLRTISLPLSYDTQPDSAGQSLEIIGERPNGFQQFGHSAATENLGLLARVGEFTVIADLVVGDYSNTIVLSSFNNKGVKVDSLNPHKTSGWDPLYLGVEYVEIRKGIELIVFDTVQRWQADENGFPLKSTLRTSADKRSYFLTKEGYFDLGP